VAPALVAKHSKDHIMKKARFNNTNPLSQKEIPLITLIKWDSPRSMLMENSFKISTHLINNSRGIVNLFNLKEISQMRWVRQVLADKTRYQPMATIYFNRTREGSVPPLHKWIRKIYNKINLSILWRTKAMRHLPQEAREAILRREKDTCLHRNLLNLYSQNTSI